MKPITELSHLFLAPALHRQAVCIDATLGQGSDARFFLSSNARRVFGYEIQPETFAQTAAKLNDPRFSGFCKSHEHMKEDLADYAGNVDAIIFNLGWDPAQKAGIKTEPETTWKAVKAGLELLRQKGRMAIACYPHDQGQKEKALLLQQLGQRDDIECVELHYPAKNNAPSLLCIEKTEKTRTQHG